MMPAYKPTPIDTSGVELSPEQRQLVERLASNTHDVWAAKRIADGWSWGQRRDDHAKQHPCLIPYEDLPASEKAYDIEMVEHTIKAALSLGYRVVAPQ